MHLPIRVPYLLFALGLALSSVAARAQDDPIPGESYTWQVQARGVYFHPMNQHVPLPIDLKGGVTGELAAEWLFMQRWSTEIAVSGPADLDVTDGSGGTIRLFTQTWTVKYYLTSVAVGGLVPYVGTGLYHASASQVGARPGVGVQNPGFGWVAQAGFTYGVTPNLFVSGDVRYLDGLEPGLVVNGAGSGSVGIDPILLSLGVGLRF
jgi:outer membrane protein W